MLYLYGFVARVIAVTVRLLGEQGCGECPECLLVSRSDGLSRGWSFAKNPAGGFEALLAKTVDNNARGRAERAQSDCLYDLAKRPRPDMRLSSSAWGNNAFAGAWNWRDLSLLDIARGP